VCAVSSRLFHRRHLKVKCFQEEYIRRGGNLYVTDLGIGEVPSTAIVGTVARCQDKRRGFLPRQRTGEPSVAQMRRLLKRGGATPPVRVYQLDSELYVVEGHTKVEAAKSLGLDHLEAHVLSYTEPSGTLEGLQRRERAEFECKTGLAAVNLTLPGRYPALFRQLQEHHIYLEKTRGHLFLFAEAVADWWQNVYSPVTSGLRQDGALDIVPGLTAGDVYSYLTEFLEREARMLNIPLTKAMKDLITAPGLTWL